MKFYVRYKSGATFIYTHEGRSSLWIKYYIEQYKKDPSVDRVLMEVQ